MSLASQHKSRWADRRNGSRGTPATVATVAKPSGVDAVWSSQVKADWDRLKANPDHAERDRQKPALVQRYWDEYLQDWYTSGKATQPNAVLAVVSLWAVDVPECRYLPELLDAAVQSRSVIPEYCRFKSDLLTHVSDTVRNRAEQVYKDSQAGVADGVLREFLLPLDVHLVYGRAIHGDFSVNFVSLAKYHKLAGLEAESGEHWEPALQHYTEANKYPNVAVKGRLENAQAMVKALSPQATGVTTGDADQLLAKSTAVDPGTPVLNTET